MRKLTKNGVLLCSVVLIGMFTANLLSVQASSCQHTICQSIFDEKILSFQMDGHYGDRGISNTCVNCGYNYWTRVEHNVKLGNHKMSNFTQTVNTPYLDVFEAHCTTPGCPYVNIKEYNKNP